MAAGCGGLEAGKIKNKPVAIMARMAIILIMAKPIPSFRRKF